MQLDTKNIRLSLAIFFILTIFSFSWIALAEQKSSSDKNILIDADQDGLSDQEEEKYGTNPQKADTDGDGYSDKSEIESGYNPLKPAPGDKLTQEEKIKFGLATDNSTDDTNKKGNETNSENLTQEISNKLITLLKNPDPDKKELTLNDLNNLIEETLDPKITYEDLPEINQSEIKIKKIDCKKLEKEACQEKEKQADLEYLTAISYILINNSPHQLSSQKDIDNFSQEILSQISSFSNSFDDSYFRKFIDVGEKALEDIQEVEVPENMLEIHTKGLKILKYAISLKKEPKPNKKDPISSMISLSKVQGVLTLLMDFSNDIEIELQKLGISEESIDLLNNL